jgi:hypothetical protein
MEQTVRLTDIIFSNVSVSARFEHTQKQSLAFPFRHWSRSDAYHPLQAHPLRSFGLHIQSHSHTACKSHSSSGYLATLDITNPWEGLSFLLLAYIKDEVPDIMIYMFIRERYKEVEE